MIKTPTCFLVNRGGTFYASMHVPSQLRERMGITLLRKNLRTGNHDHAVGLLPQVARDWADLIGKAADADPRQMGLILNGAVPKAGPINPLPKGQPMPETPKLRLVEDKAEAGNLGDINSDARGSGARYNAGKPDMQLIPLTLLSNVFGEHEDIAFVDAVTAVGEFQATGEVTYLDDALTRLRDRFTDAARVFEYGRRKYAEWNWAKGMSWSSVISCAGRHAYDHLRGIELDIESGQTHVGHFICNVIMLRTFAESYPEGNDLPPSGLLPVMADKF